LGLPRKGRHWSPGVSRSPRTAGVLSARLFAALGREGHIRSPKSQHHRAMRSAGFAWGGVGGQMERPPAWTELGLRWTARSRLNLPTPHYLPPTTASTIWCGTATSAIAAGKQGPQTTRGSAKVGSHPSCPRQYRSELAFVPRTSTFWSHSLEAVPTIHAYGDLVKDLHFTG
jgi:hypothetical protein